MKKIITFILALVMIMSMVACGSTTNEDPITSTPSETPVVENIPTTSEEPVQRHHLKIIRLIQLR